MKRFREYGKLFKHDIGAVWDDESKTYIGTAMLCRSREHTSMSLNITDFKFASKCFQYVYFQNRDDKTAVTPMEQAVELFKNGKQLDGRDFKIIEWFDIEHPNDSFELPF